MLYATAHLKRNGSALRKEEVVLKQEYRIEDEQAKLLGSRLQVIAGPHSDFCTSSASDDVYTVLLLAPVEGTERHVKFFNSDIAGCWSYVVIHIV